MPSKWAFPLGEHHDASKNRSCFEKAVATDEARCEAALDAGGLVRIERFGE